MGFIIVCSSSSLRALSRNSKNGSEYSTIFLIRLGITNYRKTQERDLFWRRLRYGALGAVTLCLIVLLIILSMISKRPASSAQVIDIRHSNVDLPKQETTSTVPSSVHDKQRRLRRQIISTAKRLSPFHSRAISFFGSVHSWSLIYCSIRQTSSSAFFYFLSIKKINLIVYSPFFSMGSRLSSCDNHDASSHEERNRDGMLRVDQVTTNNQPKSSAMTHSDRPAPSQVYVKDQFRLEFLDCNCCCDTTKKVPSCDFQGSHILHDLHEMVRHLLLAGIRVDASIH